MEVRVVLLVLGLYVLVRGTARLRALWSEVPSEPRLLWLVLVFTGAASVFANIVGLTIGVRVSPGVYASAIPLLFGAAAVSLPVRYRL